MMRFIADVATVLKQNPFCNFLLNKMTVRFFKGVLSLIVTRSHYKQSDKLCALIMKQRIA